MVWKIKAIGYLIRFVAVFLLGYCIARRNNHGRERFLALEIT